MLTQIANSWFVPLLVSVVVQIFAVPSDAAENPKEMDNSKTPELSQEHHDYFDPVMTTGPCASDVQTYCKDITPGAGRILACLKAHDDKLSAPCQQQAQVIMNQFRDVRKACQRDMQKFCKNVKPGGGDVMRCLKQHESELTQSCKNEMPLIRATG